MWWVHLKAMLLQLLLGLFEGHVHIFLQAPQVPQQSNLTACGVFMLVFAELASRGL